MSVYTVNDFYHELCRIIPGLKNLENINKMVITMEVGSVVVFDVSVRSFSRKGGGETLITLDRQYFKLVPFAVGRKVEGVIDGDPG